MKNLIAKGALLGMAFALLAVLGGCSQSWSCPEGWEYVEDNGGECWPEWAVD